MQGIPVPHKTYDIVFGHDWSSGPLTLYLNGSSRQQAIDMAIWCSRTVGKLKVTFPDHHTVRYTKVGMFTGKS